MNYGYIRIRELAENREEAAKMQAKFLEEKGIEKIFIETDGSKLQEMLDSLEPGDSIHVFSIDKLTRSVSRMAEFAHHFQKNNITLYERGQRVNLDMFYFMNELKKLELSSCDEYEVSCDDQEIENNDIVDLCFNLLECNTSHAARKIISAIPEDKLKYVVLFLHGKYIELSNEYLELLNEI